MLALIGIVSAFVAGIAVYLHQKAATQIKIAAAVAAAVAEAKSVASSVASKV